LEWGYLHLSARVECEAGEGSLRFGMAWSMILLGGPGSLVSAILWDVKNRHMRLDVMPNRCPLGLLGATFI
jgi:hypothetical protein